MPPAAGSAAAAPLRAVLALIATAALVWLLTRGASPYLTTLVAVMFINAALAVSLTLTNGMTGMFSLGHPAFMTIGAYVAAILTFPSRRKGSMLPDLPEFIAGLDLSLLPAALIAGVVGAAIAFLVGLPVLRLRGHYLAVATLGLIVIVQGLAMNWNGITRGGAGLSGIPRLSNIWWAFGFLALTFAAVWRIKHSSLGRAMMATRENDLAAECTGIDTVRMRMLAFVLGAFFAAVAGALMVHLISVVTPRTYSILLAFNLVVMIVIGGSGSIVGAVLAAFAITGLSEAMRPVEESFGLYGMSQVIVALSLILVLYFRPQGLFGSGEPWPVTRYLNGRRR
ncbi:MAG: branched-chain amino acid ABC transporter permease [Aquamicrobium sp.]|uniref:branched-chain amino acid ABC transporter permease n=1 Tax=Aquamicrobium sp. TaxID=1872579 RepID=UPI00349E90C5|nr:branched-chain amino acid ABC transporter permease [Aquamicrobium sp.]